MASTPLARKTGGMFGSPEGIVNRWWSFKLTARRQFSRLLGATLFPPRCSLCGFEGSPPDLDLCGYCQAELPWEVTGPHTTHGSFDGIAHGAVVAALHYEPPVDGLIGALKYQHELAHARVLGELLAQAVRRQARDRGYALPAALLPVPLHPTRLRERGFNQALLIARHAGRALGIRWEARALRRVRNTPSQTGLSKVERRANVQGAFELSPGRPHRRMLQAGHVALVDDVLTTGSTLLAARERLIAAGLTRVDLWACARAGTE
jgi:ComF family protein